MQCIYLQFQNHRQRNEKKFHDYLTPLTSTETQLTQARFKLTPSGTRSVVMPVNSVLSHLIQLSASHHWGQDWFENDCTWKQFVNTLPKVMGFLQALRLIPSAGKVNLTRWVRLNRIISFMSHSMHSKLTATDLTCVHSYGRFLFFDLFLAQMHLKSKQTV